MAEFEKLIVTEKGKALVMKTVNSEHRILFSRIAVSNVGYAQEELISLETIEGIRQMTVLSEIETDGPDSIRIHAILSNAQLEEGYYLRTVGLYAEDPDEGRFYMACRLRRRRTVVMFHRSADGLHPISILFCPLQWGMPKM